MTLDQALHSTLIPLPRDAESAGLCSADNDIIVLFVFAVTKYPRETSSQRACLFWLRAIELLISDGEEKPGEQLLHGRQEIELETHRKGPG